METASKPLDLPITFGICVGPGYNEEWLQNCIESIRAQHVPEYEIILMGTDKPFDEKFAAPDVIRVHSLDYSWWLPAKKNRIAQRAKYENLCIVHDYYVFDEHWYEGIQEYVTSAEKYNKHWDLISCFVQRLEDGERGPDWVINPFYMKRFLDQPENQDIFRDIQTRFPDENHPMYVVGLNPFEERFVDLQYNSGGYIMCKRELLREIPFDETLQPGTAEDVEWYERVKASKKFRLRFNPFSIVYTQKPNKWKVYGFPPEYYPRLEEALKAGVFENA